MGQAQINVRTRACSRTSIARTKQAALTHNVRGKELIDIQGDQRDFKDRPTRRVHKPCTITCNAHNSINSDSI